MPIAVGSLVREELIEQHFRIPTALRAHRFVLLLVVAGLHTDEHIAPVATRLYFSLLHVSLLSKYSLTLIIPRHYTHKIPGRGITDGLLGKRVLHRTYLTGLVAH